MVYHNDENGYSVLRLSSEDGALTAVGCFPGVACGEEVEIEGAWTTHPSYGEQFQAVRVQRRLPETKKKIYDYLAFGAVKGIGPAIAAAVVEKFGDETLQIIEAEPQRLAEVKGISPKRAEQIGADFKRSVSLRRLMEFLAAAGLGTQLALRLYRCYGDDAMDAVRANPYLLTHEYFGTDFFEADRLASSLGFEDDCPERVEAAVLFELRHNLNNGHVFLPQDKLTAAVVEMIGTEESLVSDAEEMLTVGGELVRCEIAGMTVLYLAELYEAETQVARRILAMVEQPVIGYRKPDQLIGEIEERYHIQYAESQKEAIRLAGSSNIMVLTGGPGTGKTTSVRGILALLDELGLKTALAAPTGRAANRMSELCGREAFTVHRLLGAGYADDQEKLIFEHNASDPIDADAVILDESSMVDILLMASLLDAMKPDCRLILVGDANQLPSVGPGNVFSDIIRSGAVPAVKLTEIFRQAKESHIVRNAHLIRQGVVPALAENKGDFFVLGRSSEDRTVDTVVELCEKRLPENLGVAPSDIQVLAPGRRRECGTVNLNIRLQAALNPPDESKKETTWGDYVFREGDRVMQIRNNYDIIWKKSDGLTQGTGIFNGDIGRIVRIDTDRELIVIDFDGKTAEYPFEMLYDIEPAFAVTVHKSQGSEYKVVVLALYGGAQALMTRGVLYTAVTRAREMLIIVGDPGAVARMTKDDRRQRRYSGLKTRLTPEKTEP